MAKFTSGFGFLLAMVGIMGYLMTFNAQPAEFGVALMVCGVLANSESQRQRMIWMHVSAAVGLMAFVLSGSNAGRGIVREHRLHARPAWNTPFQFSNVIALMTLTYVLVCAISFLLARRKTARLARA
jgi:hypothetical protein